VQYERVIKGVALVLGLLTAVLTVVGIVVEPAILFLALMFGLATYFMHYHLSGRMAASLYERVERQAAQETGGRRGGFGAGPRQEWERPGDRRRRRARQGRQGGRRRQRARRPGGASGPSPAEAYDRLGLDPGADEDAVKAAYREKVKEVHPDTESGSEAEFKRVKSAYETLTGE